MIIGVPKEIKTLENRVGLVPATVAELSGQGHTVYVENNAGLGSGFSNQDYEAVGAKVLATAQEVFAIAEMIVKVKEPQSSEISMLRPDQILFTYLHLAPDAEQTEGLINSGAICIAYETVEDRNGRLPLLTPMSEVAGRLSVQIGAKYLERPNGGKGVLMNGVSGTASAHVVVIGGGVSGTEAAKVAIGMGAKVTLFERSLDRIRYLKDIFGNSCEVLMSNKLNISAALKTADMVIGAVLVPGAAAPRVVTKEMLGLLEKGSVMVDIAIDQGGCFETSKPTSHSDPVYDVDGITHYCVTNMPGAVPRTSTFALNNATYHYVMQLANKGLDSLKTDPGFLKGLNVYKGKLTCSAVAEAQGKDWVEPASVL
jgi:alanine dehydrogenase